MLHHFRQYSETPPPKKKKNNFFLSLKGSIVCTTINFFSDSTYFPQLLYYEFDVFEQIKPEQALAASEAQMELHELNAWAEQIRKKIDLPLNHFG